MLKEVVIATGNAHKIAEIEVILREIYPDLSIYSLRDEKIEEPEEYGNTFVHNALIKAQHYYRFLKKPILTDDSGICVDALKNQPGVHSKRYSPSGEDLENNLKMLQTMNEIKERTCHYVCAVCLYLHPQKFYLFEGYLIGEVAQEMRGSNGFGYDSIFYLPKYQKNVAELDPLIKQNISHRRDALNQMKKILEVEGNYGK